MNIPRLDLPDVSKLPKGVPGLSARTDLLAKEKYHKKTIALSSRIEMMNSVFQGTDPDIITHSRPKVLATSPRPKLPLYDKQWQTSYREDFEDSPAQSIEQKTERNRGDNNDLVLRFFMWQRENLSENVTTECYRIRKFVLLYYVLSGDIQINEPRVVNSGIAQGVFLKRTNLETLFTPRAFVPEQETKTADVISMPDVRQFKIGSVLNIIGRDFTLYDCDKTTRDFFERTFDKDVGDPMEPPSSPQVAETPRTGRGLAKIDDDELRFNGNFYGNFKQYLEYGNQTLSFLATWTDPTSGSRDTRVFSINYFLCDDTIEIREKLEPNSGRGVFSTFLKRSKPIIMDEEEGKERFLFFKDFLSGSSVIINHREFVLLDCSKPTKDFYLTYGIEQKVHPDKTKILDSLKEVSGKQVTYEMLEKDKLQVKRRKAYKKLHQFGSQALKLRLKCLGRLEEESAMELVLAFYLADDMLELFEPHSNNAGGMSGKYLEKGSYINDKTGKTFTVKDIKKAIENKEEIWVMKRRYSILYVSKFTQQYLQIAFENPIPKGRQHFFEIAKKFSDFSRRTKFSYMDVFHKLDPNSRKYLTKTQLEEVFSELEEMGLILSHEEKEKLKIRFCCHTRFYYQDFCDEVIKALRAKEKGDIGWSNATNYGTVHEIEQLLFNKLENEGTSLRQVFRKFDTDRSGELTFTEFQDMLKHYNLNLSHSQIAAIMERYDKDKQGLIDYNEFCNRLLSGENETISAPGKETDGTSAYLDMIQGEENKFHETKYKQGLITRFCGLCASKKSELRQIFRQMDGSKDGKISRQEFTLALSHFPEFSTSDQSVIMAYFFLNDNHEINYEEFMRKASESV